MANRCAAVKQRAQVWQPAVRLVVIETWQDERGDLHSDLLHVLGIQSTVGPDGGADHQPLIWVDGGLWTLSDVRHSYGGGNVTWSDPMPCPWPPSRDEKRLAKAIAQAKAEFQRTTTAAA